MSATNLLITSFSLLLSALILLRTRLGRAVFRKLKHHAPRASPVSMGLILGFSVFVAYLMWGSVLEARLSSRLSVPNALVLSAGLGTIAYFGCRKVDDDRDREGPGGH